MTVARYYWIYEAEMGRNLLESHGIQSTILDTGITSANPLLATALGGIRLNVLVEDAEAAVAILRNAGMELQADQRPWCPECESENVEKYKMNTFLKILNTLTFGLLTVVFARSYRCHDCGHKWW